MKRTSQIYCTLALLLMSLGAVPSANAAGLLGFGPPPTAFTNSATPPAVITVPGLPSWFQDQNEVAVQPCLDAVPCALVARAPNPLSVPPDPGFDPALPLVFPTNFPDEAFYFAAVAAFKVGPFDAQFTVTQEFVFLDNPDPALGKPTFPGAPVAVPAPFQRLRFAYTFNGLGGAGVPPAAAVAPGTNFILKTPWGDMTFNLQDALNNPATNTKCERALAVADTRCLFTRDIFANTLPVPPDFTPALAGSILPTDFGGSPMSTFLQDPAAAPGFLGSAANVPISFTGAPAGRANIFSVTDPMGNTASTIALKSLTGKKFGMEAAPRTFDFVAPVPVTTPVTTSPATTITVTNPDTARALTLGTLTLTGTNPADFSITADTCSTVTLPAAPVGAPPSTCTVSVAFAPKPLAAAPGAGVRRAIVNIPGTLAGTASPTRLVDLSGTATITTTGTGNNPPTSPVLMSPTNGQTGVPTTMTFTWKKSVDPDGDAVTYHLTYSTDPAFAVSQTVNVASAKSAGLLFAGLGSMGGGIIMFGFVSGSGMKRSRKLLLVIPVLLLIGTLFTACGGGGGGTPSAATDQVSSTVTGLAANTTYYWKVSADDGKGGIATSETFSFKTQ